MKKHARAILTVFVVLLATAVCLIVSLRFIREKQRIRTDLNRPSEDSGAFIDQKPPSNQSDSTGSIWEIPATPELDAIAPYVFLFENASLNTKLYSRTINGIPSEDYYEERYSKNGELVERLKSEHSLDAETARQLEQTYTLIIQEMTEEERKTLTYYCLDGDWRLLKYVYVDFSKAYRVDVLTGEEVIIGG